MSGPRPALIDIHLDGGGIFGMRTWHNVPRIGEAVVLNDGRIVRVVDVVWIETKDDNARMYDCRVILKCATPPDTTKAE